MITYNGTRQLITPTGDTHTKYVLYIPRPESLIAYVVCHKFIAGKFYLLTISDTVYPVINLI